MKLPVTLSVLVLLPAVTFGLGGKVTIEPSELDQKVKNFALSELEAGSNNLLARKIVEVRSATLRIGGKYSREEGKINISQSK